MAGTERTVVEHEVRDQLARVLSSSAFSSSDRLRRFLTFVVEETLAGRGDRIKAYTVATSAFGRRDDFDPQQDSIVRIEAGRLRRALEHYYLTEGSADAVRIVIPKGTYTPEFVRADAAPDVHPLFGTRTRRRGPRILVAPFELEAGEAILPGFGAAFTRQVVIGLTRFGTLFVYGPATGLSQTPQPDLARLREEIGADFVLTGSVGVYETRLTVDLLLQEAPEGRYVWADRFERALGAAELRGLRDEVADRIVRRLAQPYGVIYSRELDHEGDAPERLGNYRAVLEYYQFVRTLDMERLEGVRQGLERAVEDDPGYAEAFACLSRLYSDMARFDNDALADLNGRLGRAMLLARKAISRAPSSSAGYHALALAHWFRGEVDECLAAFRTALALNPNDTEIMADFGLRLAARLEWQEAIPLVTESFRRNPCQATTFRMAFVIWHYFNRRFDQALAEVRMVGAPTVVYPHLLAAAAAAELGLDDEARAAVAAIERIAPGYGRYMLADLTARNGHPDLISMLAASLRKAGVQGLEQESGARIALHGPHDRERDGPRLPA
jgi:TolB-like protein